MKIPDDCLRTRFPKTQDHRTRQVLSCKSTELQSIRPTKKIVSASMLQEHAQARFQPFLLLTLTAATHTRCVR